VPLGSLEQRSSYSKSSYGDPRAPDLGSLLGAGERRLHVAAVPTPLESRVSLPEDALVSVRLIY
jgi:hypothetical protein